jgi:hypothetical protein
LPAVGAAAQTDPDLVWKGDFEAGSSSLTGNCSVGQNQYCHMQTIRPQQIQVVQSPVVQGKYAARFEVRYGDVYSYYSDSRSIMSGPDSLWEDEGNERWYRWQVLYPADWVGRYPKWDELWNTAAFSNGGSMVEWHHDGNGGVENGSAPLYFGANDTSLTMCLMDQATSTCRQQLNLAPLQRGHWHDFILHAKWSSDPAVGFLEAWIDGANVLPKQMVANKYPGMRNYLLVGLYRNGHVGDPNLLWPNGAHVYGSDGTPAVAYLDGFISGKTQQSVMNELPWGPPADAGPAAAADAGTPVPVSDPVATPPVVSSSVGGLAKLGYPMSGCSTGGVQQAWLAIPLLALLWRRRRARSA